MQLWEQNSQRFVYLSVLTILCLGSLLPAVLDSQPGDHDHWQHSPEHHVSEHSGLRSAQLLLQWPQDWNNH